MRNVIWFIIFLIFAFFINVIFFYISADYREFLQSFKEDKVITDDKPRIDDNIENDFTIEEKVDTEEDLAIVAPSNKNEEIFEKNDNNKVEIKGEVVLGKNYKDILTLFESYNLKELEINTTLFDVTTEYPDNYIEYYSKELTLYFFPTKTYNEVRDIFKVLEYELPFTINEINNF
ncbi:MAG: hypothetical protein LBF15_00115, partial [Candidatus Peribacteria bacterium]|jgi:hypothetical protein|nr:hypothetical protein [Candidatus Peribacteria bacterium]